MSGDQTSEAGSFRFYFKKSASFTISKNQILCYALSYFNDFLKFLLDITKKIAISMMIGASESVTFYLFKLREYI